MSVCRHCGLRLEDWTGEHGGQSCGSAGGPWRGDGGHEFESANRTLCNILDYEQARARALRRQLSPGVSRSKRTRWLVFLNAHGSPTVAPGARTHQLSLLFGMGLDWYKRAMAEPEVTVTAAAGVVLPGDTFTMGGEPVRVVVAP